MRIRKRQVPFPLSSLSPIPLSDLHLNHPSSPPPPVQHNHHQQQQQHVHHHLQPSDQTNQLPSPIGNSKLGDFSTPADSDDGPHDHDVEKNKACLGLMMMRKHEEDKREEEKKSNDTKNGSILGAQTSTGVLPLSASSPQVGRWCEGERAFPLKKRRGSLGRRSLNDEESSILVEKEKKVVMKTKVNKKCVQHHDNGNIQETDEANNEAGNNDNDSKNIGARKKGIVRGGAIMEGSRCSRVNGRGWRCCQQTLVGYSLCEHHLGKGRLRSMTSVRSRAIATTSTTTTTTTIPLRKNIGAQEKLASTRKFLNNGDNDDESDEEEEDDEDEKKPLMVTKKRMKLGMVKARSLSILLGQTDNAAVSVADNNSINNDD